MFARVRGQGVHVRPSTRGPAARTAPGGLTETLGGGRGGLRTAGASPASARASGPAPSTPARPRSLRLEDACLLGPASWLEAVCRVVVGGRPSRPGLALALARRGPHGHHAGGVPTGLNRRRARPPVDDVPAGPGVCWLPTRLPASQACSRSDSVLRRLTFVAGPAINDLRSPGRPAGGPGLWPREPTSSMGAGQAEPPTEATRRGSGGPRVGLADPCPTDPAEPSKLKGSGDQSAAARPPGRLLVGVRVGAPRGCSGCGA